MRYISILVVLRLSNIKVSPGDIVNEISTSYSFILEDYTNDLLKKLQEQNL